MKPFARTFYWLALAAGLFAGGTAVATDKSESRPVSGFTALSLSAPIRVEVTQAEVESLVLEGDERALADLETVVEKGVLRIRTRSRSDWPRSAKVRARLGVKMLEALAIGGSGDVSAARLKGGPMKIAVSGSGAVSIADVDFKTLDVSVSGSGDVKLGGGRADELKVNVAGSGDVAAPKMKARRASVSIAGSGDVVLWAAESLTASVVGSGDVRYYGDPAMTKASVGSGSVKRLGAAPA